MLVCNLRVENTFSKFPSPSRVLQKKIHFEYLFVWIWIFFLGSYWNIGRGVVLVYSNIDLSVRSVNKKVTTNQSIFNTSHWHWDWSDKLGRFFEENNLNIYLQSALSCKRRLQKCVFFLSDFLLRSNIFQSKFNSIEIWQLSDIRSVKESADGQRTISFLRIFSNMSNPS